MAWSTVVLSIAVSMVKGTITDAYSVYSKEDGMQWPKSPKGPRSELTAQRTTGSTAMWLRHLTTPIQVPVRINCLCDRYQWVECDMSWYVDEKHQWQLSGIGKSTRYTDELPSLSSRCDSRLPLFASKSEFFRRTNIAAIYVHWSTESTIILRSTPIILKQLLHTTSNTIYSTL